MTGGRRTFRGGGGGGSKKKKGGRFTHTHTHTERYVESVCVCMKVRVPRWLVDQFYLFRAARQTQIHFSPEHVHRRFSLVRFFFYSDPKRSEWYSRRAQGEKKKKEKKKEITSFWKLVSFQFFFFKKRTKSIHPPFKKIRERGAKDNLQVVFRWVWVSFSKTRSSHTQTVRK